MAWLKKQKALEQPKSVIPHCFIKSYSLGWVDWLSKVISWLCWMLHPIINWNDRWNFLCFSSILFSVCRPSLFRQLLSDLSDFLFTKNRRSICLTPFWLQQLV
jgi:hypothetical protein